MTDIFGAPCPLGVPCGVRHQDAGSREAQTFPGTSRGKPKFSQAGVSRAFPGPPSSRTSQKISPRGHPNQMSEQCADHCTSPSVNPTPLTHEQDPEMLKLLHLGQQPVPDLQWALQHFPAENLIPTAPYSAANYSSSGWRPLLEETNRGTTSTKIRDRNFCP